LLSGLNLRCGRQRAQPEWLCYLRRVESVVGSRLFEWVVSPKGGIRAAALQRIAAIKNCDPYGLALLRFVLGAELFRMDFRRTALALRELPLPGPSLLRLRFSFGGPILLVAT
jgi:hypothetical protein